VITGPTPFYGETTLGRMREPWGNLWWLYAPVKTLSTGPPREPR
jgi:hypothetical protein